jgi:hypothetical protein
MAVDVVQLRDRPRRFVPWLILVVGLVFFAVLVWTIFWRVAAQQSAVSLDAWIAREKAFNRSWTCPDRKIAGFPFAIEIACSKPHFDGIIFGRHYSGSLNGFLATAKFMSPNVVTVKAASPFAILGDDRTVDVSLSWTDLTIALGGLPKDVSAITISGHGLKMQGHAPGLGSLDGQAGRATATLTRDVSRADRAIAFHVKVNDATSPIVDALLRTAAPADISAEGTVTQASFDPAKTLVRTLDQWRSAGGHVDFADFQVTRGETKFQAQGALTVDAAHQLQGKLATQMLGFEPVLRRLGVNPALINAGSLLSSLLGGGSNGAAAGPQPLRLPVGFDEGHLNIGPVRTSIRVPPLY